MISEKQCKQEQCQQILDERISLNPLTQPLSSIFGQLKAVSKQRLDGASDNINGVDAQQIKGLKFISAKLAKLFIKNRLLPYNQISKILIDNFASQSRDERNIKRRVYDAINVLVASDVLIKKNNNIQMIKNRLKTKMLQADRKEKTQDQIRRLSLTIAQKKFKVQQLIEKKKIIKKLMQRNKKMSPKISTGTLKQSELKNTKNKLTQNYIQGQTVQQPKIFILFNPSNKKIVESSQNQSKSRNHRSRQSSFPRSLAKQSHLSQAAEIIKQFSIKENETKLFMEIPNIRNLKLITKLDNQIVQDLQSKILSFLDIVSQELFNLK